MIERELRSVIISIDVGWWVLSVCGGGGVSVVMKDEMNFCTTAVSEGFSVFISGYEACKDRQ
jgi:hypothetical protein